MRTTIAAVLLGLFLYKVFEDFDEATKWVERMADYRLRDEWPEEIPNYEVLKTIQKLQGIDY